MQKNKESQTLLGAVILIVFAAFSRFIPHPFNFTAIGAMALFSGANINDKKYTFLLPMIAMFLTDLYFGFHFSILPVYACFAFTVWMGIKIKNNQRFYFILSASILSSIIFFLITNLPFWYADLQLYPMTFTGTLQSYSMAIPFFKNQLFGDLFYNSVLFGIYHFAFRKNVAVLTEKIR